MNCKRIKELILTDYADAELKGELKQQLEQHLKSCLSCREFAQAVEKQAIQPFKQLEKIPAPEYLWQRIKDKITLPEPKLRPAFSGIWENLQLLFHPKPALVLATIAVVVIVSSVLLKTQLNRNQVNLYVNDQVDFVSYLGQNGNGGSELNLGTAIEELFL